MGLDTTHNAWHGPYSSFGTWRTWVAKQIGIKLDEMVGYGGDIVWDNSNSLTPLLNHSDCDGELTVEECKKIEQGLLVVLSRVERKKENEYFIEKTAQFRNGCLDAIKKDENILFH